MRTLSIVDVEREIGLRGSLYDFVKMTWHLVEPGTEFVDNWHIPLICKHLEALFARRIKRLIINVPPGCMKSLLVSVFWPAWIWLRDPAFRSINASFDGSLTARDAAKVLDIVQSYWYQARWGDKFKLLGGKPPITEFKTSHSGLRFSTSVGGRATGWHADALCVDDPLKPKGVSPVTLEGVIKWWGGTLASRFRTPTTGLKVIIMQRLHDRDLCGHVLEGKHEKWVHLRLPMRYESKYPCETVIGKDPRTVDGELLWPARHTEETVTALAIDLGPIAAAAQLQQRPVPEGGAIFRSEWFHTYEVAPSDFDEIYQSWDCAFKGTTTSDWVVGQVWGRKGSRYYLLDQVRAQMGFYATVQAVRAMARKWPKAVGILIEEAANGTAVCDALETGLSEDTADVHAFLSNVIRVKPEGGKVARANACTGIFEAGNVAHPRPEDAPWIDQHQREMLSFPMGANDDTVDTCTQALNYMRLNQSFVDAALKRLLAGD